MSRHWIVGILSLLLACAGCTGTEVGNPQDQDTAITDTYIADTDAQEDIPDFELPPGESEAQLALRGYDSAPQGALVLGSGETIDEAWMLVTFAGLKRSDDCEGDPGEGATLGAFAVELVSGQTLPARGSFRVEAGDFCRLELSLETLNTLPAGVPVDLSDASVLLKGKHSNGLPFTVIAELDTTIRMDALDDGFRLESGVQGLLVGVALNVVLGEASIFNLLPGLDGIIRLTEDLTPLQLEALETSVKQSVSLFRDHNRDGALDPEDLSDVLGEGQP